jgi:hypothetical protein
MKWFLRAVPVLLILFLLAACAAGTEESSTNVPSRELTLEALCGNSTLSPEAVETALETAMGMPWAEYKVLLSEAIETKDYAAVTLELEGQPAYFVIHKNADETKIRAISICLTNSDTDAEAWLSYTQLIWGKLDNACKEKQSFSTYLFDGGQITLNFGPVDSEDYEVNQDGTASYAGIPSELGNRIEDIRITFEQ